MPNEKSVATEGLFSALIRGIFAFISYLSYAIFPPTMQKGDRSGVLNVEAIGYGWPGGDRRVLAYFHVPLQADRNETLQAIVRDMKHSKDWTCEFCDKPERETYVQMMSWEHLSPPRLTFYLHFVCNLDAPHVRKNLHQIQSYANMVSVAAGGPSGPRVDDIERKVPGESYPFAASCGGCQLDSTVPDKSGKGQDQMQRCSGCKLLRYCGATCQRNDWPRHKLACKTLYEAKWEGWE